MEYFFCDTHKELPETYEFLDKLKARLGIKLNYLSPERGFDHWLEMSRTWCAKSDGSGSHRTGI